MLSGGIKQNVLSFTPPFVITEAEIDFALEQLHDAEAAIR
jgi:4-aminobutyrate aminotransferase-like enzyme